MGSDLDELHGARAAAEGSRDFNMTALAMRGSRFQNGVSRIHGDVSSEICRHLWPQIEPDENPMTYVTNGVHVPTFLADDWHETFDRYPRPRLEPAPDRPGLLGRHPRDSRPAVLERAPVAEVADAASGAPPHRRAAPAQPGLARRTSTACCKLADPANPERADHRLRPPLRHLQARHAAVREPGLAARDRHRPEAPGAVHLRRQGAPGRPAGAGHACAAIAEVARMPEFEGNILLVEGYDLRLARRLVSGVDVWLNNPIYPLEASGTSGMKAAINGVHQPVGARRLVGRGLRRRRNGWAIKPASDAPRRQPAQPGGSAHAVRDSAGQRDPALLQPRADGLFAGLGADGQALHRVTLLPRFNTARMLGEYVSKFYLPATEQWRRFSPGQFRRRARTGGLEGEGARRLDRVELQPPRHADAPHRFRRSRAFEVAVSLNGLAPEDVTVEVLFGRPARNGGQPRRATALCTWNTPGARRATRSPVRTGADAGNVRQDRVPLPRLSLPRVADPSLRDGDDGLALSGNLAADAIARRRAERTNIAQRKGDRRGAGTFTRHLANPGTACPAATSPAINCEAHHGLSPARPLRHFRNRPLG